LPGFDWSVTASLVLDASEMGQPPQPPEEQVLQELSGFFFENSGSKTKMKAIRTISAATRDCTMVKRIKNAPNIEYKCSLSLLIVKSR
jgi:hypothetical protein